MRIIKKHGNKLLYKELENILTNMKKQERESDSYKIDKRFMSFKEWKRITSGGKLLNKPMGIGSDTSE